MDSRCGFFRSPGADEILVVRVSFFADLSEICVIFWAGLPPHWQLRFGSWVLVVSFFFGVFFSGGGF